MTIEVDIDAPDAREQLLDLPEDLFIGPDSETVAAVDGPIFPADDEAAA